MAVVVGFLASDEGRSALDAGVAQTRLLGGRLMVIVYGGRGEDPAAIDAAEEEARERLEDSDVAHEVRQVARGDDAADVLIHAAQESAAQLLVIGLRKRSATGKLILGSNAQRILLDAPCPVLAVKPATPSRRI